MEREERERENRLQADREAKSGQLERSPLQEERRGRRNPEVFLKVEIRDLRGAVAKGRLDCELYADKAPKTAENWVRRVVSPCLAFLACWRSCSPAGPLAVLMLSRVVAAITWLLVFLYCIFESPTPLSLTPFPCCYSLLELW